MNWIIHILTSRSGKLAKGPLIGGVITVGTMALTLGGYQHDVAKYERPDRNIVSARDWQDNSVTANLERAQNGELTAMSSYLQGRGGTGGIRFGGQEQFSGVNLENVENGMAARIGQADRLSQGGAEADLGRIENARPADGVSVRASGRNFEGSSGRSYSAAYTPDDGNSFSSASMARASGSESLSTGAGVNGSSGGSSRPGASGGSNGGDDYQLSGSMPTSNSISALANANLPTHTASFNGQRDVHGRKGRHLHNGGSIKEIADTSLELAKMGRSAGANAGSRPFLDGGQVGGGVTYDDTSVGSSSGDSSDFNSVSTGNIQNNVQNKVDEVNEELEKEKKARKRLTIEILAFLAAAAVAAYLMYLSFYLAKKKLEAALVLQNQAAGFRMKAAAEPHPLVRAGLLAQAGICDSQAAALRVASAALNKKGWLLFAGACTAGAVMLEESLRFGLTYSWGAVPIMGIASSAGIVAGLFYLKVRALTDAVATDTSTILSAQIATFGKSQAASLVGGTVANQVSGVFTNGLKG